MDSYYSFLTLLINFESLPNFMSNVFDSFNKYNNLTDSQKKIINSLFGVILLIPIFLVIRFITQVLNIQAFDIKLQHKNEQSRFRVSKFLSLLIVITFYFSLIQTMVAIGLNGNPQFSNMIIIISALFFILGILIVINIMIHNGIRFLQKRKFKSKLKKKKSETSMELPKKTNLPDSPYTDFTNKSKEFAWFTFAFVGVLLCSLSTKSIIFSKTADRISEIPVVLTTTLFISTTLITVAWTKNKKTEFIFLGVKKVKPNLKLFLDYKLNENTTILHSENKAVYVVKKVDSGETTYEVFQVFEKGPVSDESDEDTKA